MTSEQQAKLLDAVQTVLEKHGEVAESIAGDESEETLINSFNEFTTAFTNLNSIYSDITGEETEEVQKNDSSWNNLFGVMNDHN